MFIRKLIKNYIVILFITFLSLVGSFFTNIFINYYYGKTEFGQYSTIYNIALFFSVFVAFGAGKFLLREISISKNRFVNSIPYLKRLIITTYMFSFVGYLLFIMFINYETKLKILLLISMPIIFFLGSINLYSNINIAQKEFIRSTIISTSLHLTIFISLIPAFIFKLSFEFFIMTLSITSLVITLYIFYKINRFFMNISSENNFKSTNNVDFKKVFKSVYPFGIIGLFYFIYYQSDIMILSFYKSSDVVAEYNAAFSILAALLVFPKVLYQRLLAPYIYESHHRGKGNKKFKYLQLIFILSSVLAYIILIVFSKLIINLLFGDNYTDAPFVLMILGASFVLRFIYGYSGVIMDFEENLKYKMNIMAITASVNIILNLLFIPEFGVYAAALSTVLSEILLSFLLVCKRYSIAR